MIQHPFLDFKGLSDDDLLAKAIEIQKKLIKAQMWGASQDIIGQLNWMMDMIEEEKGERLYRQRHEQFNAMFPETVESDPDFVKERMEVKEKTKAEKPMSSPKQISTFPTTFHKEYIKPENKQANKPKPTLDTDSE